MKRLKIVQITEKDKHELEELGREAVETMREFLECLDKVSDGQISDEMQELYGERRGAPGTGRYGRRMDERRGVPGTGRYARRHPSSHDRYEEEEYDERSRFDNRYDY